LEPVETWSSLEKGTPLSRCTSKRHKKETRVNKINHSSETTTTTKKKSNPTTVASTAGGRKITKGLEKLAKKNAKKAHLKRMAEIKSGKRRRYAGESFTCNIL